MPYFVYFRDSIKLSEKKFFGNEAHNQSMDSSKNLVNNSIDKVRDKVGPILKLNSFLVPAKVDSQHFDQVELKEKVTCWSKSK